MKWITHSIAIGVQAGLIHLFTNTNMYKARMRKKSLAASWLKWFVLNFDCDHTVTKFIQVDNLVRQRQTIFIWDTKKHLHLVLDHVSITKFQIPNEYIYSWWVAKSVEWTRPFDWNIWINFNANHKFPIQDLAFTRTKKKCSKTESPIKNVFTTATAAAAAKRHAFTQFIQRNKIYYTVPFDTVKKLKGRLKLATESHNSMCDNSNAIRTVNRTLKSWNGKLHSSESIRFDSSFQLKINHAYKPC